MCLSEKYSESMQLGAEMLTLLLALYKKRGER